MSWNRRVMIEMWSLQVGQSRPRLWMTLSLSWISWTKSRLDDDNHGFQMSFVFLSHEASETVMASSLGVLRPHLRRAYLQLCHEAQHLHRHHQGGQDGTQIHQSVSRWVRAPPLRCGLCKIILQYLGTLRIELWSWVLSSTAMSSSRFPIAGKAVTSKTQVPGGRMAEMYGTKKVLGYRFA